MDYSGWRDFQQKACRVGYFEDFSPKKPGGNLVLSHYGSGTTDQPVRVGAEEKAPQSKTPPRQDKIRIAEFYAHVNSTYYKKLYQW